MENQYKQICRQYRFKAKIFTKMKTNLKGQIGSPDLMIIFTATASHKMVLCAIAESEKSKTQVERCHTSSASALKGILQKFV